MNMKKVVNVFEEKAEGLDTNKRITRNVSENIRRVDNIVSSARSSSALFSSQALAARARLRDACERAIMTGSTSFTQRMEEVLWRKVYYDPLSAAKKLKKGTSWSAVEAGFIWTHLNDGIAYYHQLLSTFACSHKMVDCTADLLPIYFQDDDQMSKTSNNNNESSLKESFFRSLTCLGDLARYLLDVPPQISDSSAYLLSVRYYHQALHYNCEGGLTHSNLATVYSTNNQPLLAAVHYLRAITCEKPFEAAENNLRRMLDKSRIWLENQKISKDYSKENNFEKESNTFLHTCLALLSCFLGNRRTEEVAGLCQDVLTQMGKLLDDYDNIDPPDISEASNEGVGVSSAIVNGHNGWTDSSDTAKSLMEPSENKTKEELGSLFLLTPESMVTLCALFIVCVKRLKMQASPHHSMSEVLLVSILLTLVSHINTRLEQRFSLIDPSFIQNLLPPPEQPEKVDEIDKDKEADKSTCNGTEEKLSNKKKGKANKLAKLRRRRNREIDEDSELENSIGGAEDSDNSADDGDDGSATSSDEEDNFNSSVLCSSEDEDESDEDVKIESDQEWDGITAEEHLQIVEQEGMLAAVNVTFDWLFNNEEIIKLCNKNADTLWTSLAKLFNHIRIDYGKLTPDPSSSTKAEMIEKLLALEKMAPDTPKDKLENEKGLEMHSLSLPENLMLTVIIPSFHVSNPGHNMKSSDMNLLRLYRLYSIIYNLANRDDTPVKIEGNKFVVSKDKVSIVESTKTELSEKTSDGRTTPSTQNMASNASAHNSPKSGDHSKWDDTMLSTPKRPQPSIGRVTSSMQTLTAQWLQHEVRNLEERTNRRMNLGGLYLVPDASVLINYLPSIKKLLTARSHMVIIPQIVIDSLDQQKRDTVGARDAIRWLEVKLRHGSRFIRAQRPHERTRLPLVKYPKRKEKDAWEWFHLAECCYYLGAQLNNKSNPKTSTVTLLVGERPIKLTTKHSLSLSTLAEAAGAVLQSADEFIRKWQTSTKGHS